MRTHRVRALLMGGQALHGTFYQPTVVADIVPGMNILEEEIQPTIALGIHIILVIKVIR